MNSKNLPCAATSLTWLSVLSSARHSKTLSRLIVKTDFKDLVLTVFGVNIKYGSFITAVINFFIMAIVLFALIKLMNKAASLGKHEEAPAAPTTKKCPYCLSEIAIEATRCPHCTSILDENN